MQARQGSYVTTISFVCTTIFHNA